MFVKSLNKVLNLGISTSISRTEANRIRLINITALYPLILYIFSTIYSLIYDYPRIVFINSIALVCTGLVLYLNHRKKYSLAKSILISTTSFIVFCYYKLMMDEPGVFMYYLPIILMFLTFYSPAEEIKYLVVTGLVALLFIVLSFIFPYRYFEPFPLSVSLHKFIFLFGAITTILLTAFYVSITLMVNTQNQEILQIAREKAEEGSKAKAVFLSNMSHELRTPLNGIIGTTNILQSEKHLPEQQTHLDVLKNLSDHMLGLVNNILDYSKIESGKIELGNYPFNVSQLLDKTEIIFRSLFREKGILYKIETDHRLKTFDVYFDELRLQQILINLISNALKFTASGEVKVAASIIRDADEDVTVSFAITDTGIGMEPAIQKRIFESFSQGDTATTRKYGGTGLGLSISASLVKVMNGTLAVNSEPGRGSCFSFQISMPKFIAPAEGIKEKKSMAEGLLTNLKVLIAEDNPVNMTVAKRTLQKWGVQVAEAENGKIALEKCKEQDFDILLIDLEMPEMDGKMAVKEINKLNKQIPAIAFTAAVYEDMGKDLLSCGFTDYMLKPFKPEDLYNKMAHIKQTHQRA